MTRRDRWGHPRAHAPGGSVGVTFEVTPEEAQELDLPQHSPRPASSAMILRSGKDDARR